MRRKVVTRVTDETGAVGTSVVCYLLRSGAPLTTGGATSVPANSTATVRVKHPGALKLNDRVYWLDTDGTVTGSYNVNSAPIYNAGGYWEIVLLELLGSTTVIGTDGDLVLQWGDTDSYVTWYDDDTAGTGTSGVISPSATTGQLKFYVDVPDLDVAITSGGALSAYVRDVPVERREVVNVMEFGAVGNASNDDGPAIQAAVDYAASLDGGVEVFFPEGSYKVGAAITFDGGGSRGVVFRGVSPKSTRIRPSGNIDCISLVDTLDAVIENIEFRHHEGTATSGNMIKLDGCNRVRIRNVLWTNPYTALLCTKDTSASKTKSVWVSDCHVDIGTGASNANQLIVSLRDTIGFYASGLQIGWGTATIAAGVDIDSGVDTASFVNCVSNQSGGGIGHGYRVRDTFTSDHDARWIHFTNCFAEGGTTGDGYVVSAGNDVAIVNSYASGSQRGFAVTGGKDVRIVSNISFKNYVQGIRVSGGSDVLVQGNSVYDNDRNASGTVGGIEAVAGVTFVRVLSNVVGKTYGTAGGNTAVDHGIVMGGSSCICANNHINDSDANGIEVTGDRNIITGNVCQNNTGYGIDINTGADGCIVTGNVCISNSAGQINNSGASTEIGHNVVA